MTEFLIGYGFSHQVRIWDIVFGGGERLVSRKKTALTAEEEEGDGVRQGRVGLKTVSWGKEVVSDEIGGDQGGIHLGVGLGVVEGVLVKEAAQTEKGLLDIEFDGGLMAPVGMIGRFGISGAAGCQDSEEGRERGDRRFGRVDRGVGRKKFTKRMDDFLAFRFGSFLSSPSFSSQVAS